jgi:hypothetical protein
MTSKFKLMSVCRSSRHFQQQIGHFTGCTGCFREWVSTKIREKAVTPWLNCAEEDCTAAIHPDDIASCGISTLLLLQFVEAFTTKHLARNDGFIPCSVCFHINCITNTGTKC